MTNSNKWMGVYWLLVLILCICASAPAMGASSGTTGAAFLKVAVGPRAAAMGEAYTAVAEEAYALHYNPASVGRADRWELSAMHQAQFGNIRFDYFGLSAPVIRNRSGWGLSFVRMAVDDYARTEDDDGVKFTNADMAFTATYAHRIVEPLTIGISGKIITQSLAQYNANGWAVDFGAHLKVNPRLSLGVSMLNIGPKITFISIGDPLPTTVRVGGAFKLLPRGNLLATIDYWLPKDDADGFGIGMEYRPNRFIALRSGYQLGTDFKGFDASTYGVTFDFENFGIEYTFVPREKLGDVHKAGLNVSFGGKNPKVIAAKPRRTLRRKEKEPPPQTRRAARAAPVPDRVSGTRPEQVQTAAPTGAAASPYYGQPPRVFEQEAPASPTTYNRDIDGQMSLRQRPSAGAAPSAAPADGGLEVPDPMKTRAPASRPSVASGVELPILEVVEPEPAVVADRPAAAPERQPVPAVRETVSVPREVLPAPLPEPESAASREFITQEKLTLASALMKDGRFEEAVQIIRRGLVDDPSNVPLLYLLSEGLYRMGQYDQAMEVVNRALSVIHGSR